MKKIDLNGVWTLIDENGREISCTVPGCVHTDLYDVDFLMKNKNSKECRYIENENWIYKRKFSVKVLDNKITELVFEGIDTYCDIYLNGTLVGQAANMFIKHSFDISGLLILGDNEIEVRFRSPVKEVEGLPEAPAAFTAERLNTRRIQCTYSWDWVDRFVTCGIFKDVYIKVHDGLYVSDVYVYTENVDKYGAQVKVCEYFENYTDGADVVTEIFDSKGRKLISKTSYCQEEVLVYTFDIEQPELWYPVGMGDQPLYTLKITVENECKTIKFGIRTVKILQKTDNPGTANYELCKKLQETKSGKRCDFNDVFSGFTVIVNEVPVFCTGANWVPCEPFPSYEGKEKITECLTLAKECGINMVRVWGGGIFEQEHFYDECDRLGIMVTQDFLMACGTYPAHEEWFKGELKKEAEFVAKYLRNHPSLIWWSGDNENAVEGSDEKREYPGRIAARAVIAPVLEKFDHSRQFLYSSPYGGYNYGSKTVGTTHNTNFIDETFSYMSESKNVDDYREYFKQFTARFIAEEPVMGAVSRIALEKFISPEYIQDEDMWLYHTKTNPWLEKEILEYMTAFTEKLFGKFLDWEDKYFKMKYLQYEWVRVTMENARRNLWFCSGMVYWMLDDCWAATMGWSLIDYYNIPKAGYYSLKNCAQKIGVSLDKEDDKYFVYISNNAEKQKCKVNIYTFCGLDLTQEEQYTLGVVAENGVTKILVSTSFAEDKVVVAEVEAGDKKTRTFYKFGAPSLKRCEGVSISENDGVVYLKASKYIHTVELEGAEVFSDNFFLMLPGEERTVSYEKKHKEITVNCYDLQN